MKSTIAAIATCGVLLMLAPNALAYNRGDSFGQSANSGGGGGIYFTGSPLWKRYDCTICHTGAPGAITVEVTSDPPELMAQGIWRAGQSYDLVVRMLGETRGLTAQSNINTFFADFSGAGGTAVGTLFSDSETISTFNDGWVIGGNGLAGLSEWRFKFFPPVAGTGAISLHVAIVDGDGGENPNARVIDVIGDDVAVTTMKFCEQGTPCERAPTPPVATPDESVVIAGCAGAPTDGGTLPWLGIGLVAVLLMWRRRRANC